MNPAFESLSFGISTENRASTAPGASVQGEADATLIRPPTPTRTMDALLDSLLDASGLDSLKPLVFRLATYFVMSILDDPAMLAFALR